MNQRIEIPREYIISFLDGALKSCYEYKELLRKYNEVSTWNDGKIEAYELVRKYLKECY